MAAPPSNRLRDARLACGRSQAALAEAARLTRQSVNAIETGRATPAVDVALRLARALGTSVESLFAATPERLRAEVSAPFVGESGRSQMAEQPPDARAALAHIGGRWVAYPLAGEDFARTADAIGLAPACSSVELEPLSDITGARENLVLMGCAPALGLLAERLSRHSAPGRYLWFGRSSTAALEALARRHTHVAGVHLVDADTGESNLPDVRRLLADRALVLIALARWEVGLVTAPSNPKGLRSLRQLCRRGLRFARREPGAGARRLLDSELARLGLRGPDALLPGPELTGQVAVARAVAHGLADAGIASGDAAIAFGLGFVPLAEERYDLVLAKSDLADRRVTRLLEEMTAAPYRRELSALGYDVSPSGDRVGEITPS